MKRTLLAMVLATAASAAGAQTATTPSAGGATVTPPSVGSGAVTPPSTTAPSVGTPSMPSRSTGAGAATATTPPVSGGTVQAPSAGSAGMTTPSANPSGTNMQGVPSRVVPPASQANAPALPNAQGSANAQKKIEADGYRNVQGLQRSSDGSWSGKALRGGQMVDVYVDARGNVVTR